VFWHIVFVYMGSAFFTGVTCPSNAPDLINGSSRALKSLITVAIQNAGWAGGSFETFNRRDGGVEARETTDVRSQKGDEEELFSCRLYRSCACLYCVA